MSAALETMKKKAELMRLQASIADDECRILEREDEVQRIKVQIGLRQDRINQLQDELNKKEQG